VASYTLVAGSLMTVAEGLVYVYIGRRLGHRNVSEDARRAVRFFALWWLSIGANKALAGLVGLGAAFGRVSIDLYTVVLHLNLAILCVSLASLLYYFVYLFSGRKGAILPIAIFYAGFYILLTYNLFLAAPKEIRLLNWRTDYVAAQTTPPALGLVIVGLLVVPQAIGALSHFVLYFRTQDPIQKHRIALVSWSIVAWTVSIALILTRAFDESAALQLLSRVIGVAAAIAGWAAYRVPPPRGP
jgi:hypothetical protein